MFAFPRSGLEQFVLQKADCQHFRHTVKVSNLSAMKSHILFLIKWGAISPTTAVLRRARVAHSLIATLHPTFPPRPVRSIPPTKIPFEDTRLALAETWFGTVPGLRIGGALSLAFVHREFSSRLRIAYPPHNKNQADSVKSSGRNLIHEPCTDCSLDRSCAWLPPQPVARTHAR